MRKILLADDNAQHRELLERRLRSRGFEVLIAEDGLEAVEVACREVPDVILMDIWMPGQDGRTATRTLKARSETKDIPVIAVSADDLGDARERSLQAGCCDFEPKPLAFARLLQKIERHCTPA